MLVRVVWHQEVTVVEAAALKQVEDESDTAVRKQETADTYRLAEPEEADGSR